jgi:ParB/RepB/Spo0J family partition protein
MRLREHSAIQPGALDIFRADPRQLVVQDGYNVRDLTTPDAQEKLRELADSIAEVGVTDPLVVRFDGERIIVVEGHRRLAATMLAIEAGAEIKSVPIYQEPRGVSPEQRDLGLILSNSGEPLTPLEKAKVIGRLVAHGWPHQEIAKKCGWKSVGSVGQYLDMLAMPEAVKEQVRQGDVSATMARQIVKEAARDAKNDPDFAAELIRKNKEENKRLGVGKKTKPKVTAKTIARDKPKPEPKAKTDLAPAPEPKSVSAAPSTTPPTAPTETEPLTMADFGEGQPAAEMLPVNAPAAQADRMLVPPAGSTPVLIQHRPGIKDLIKAIEPLAKAVEVFDPEMTDEALIFISDHGAEINAGQCRAAWKAWNAATGGSSDAEAA